MDDPRCFDARLIWYQCGDCGAKLQESQRNYHNNHEHVARPHDDAMTVAEVAKVLGCTDYSVRHRIKTGKIQQYHDPEFGGIGMMPMKDEAPPPRKGKRIWILRSELQRYIRTVAAAPEAMVQWALTGKMQEVCGQDK